MTLPYHILDVFTTTPFSGNPLAIVSIPPNITLNGAQKQRIAREFNLSETVFVHPNQDDDPTSRTFDIYTPQAELPFAGHPTIGTAVHLQSQGVKILVAKAGRIELERSSDGSVRAAIPQNVHLHSTPLPLPTVDPASNPLQLDIAKAQLNAPLFSIVSGMTFALVELPSLAHLAAVRVGVAPELPVELLDEGWRVGWVTRSYYYVRLDARRIRTRMIKAVPAMEDPATGSAACALSCYLGLYRTEAGMEEVGFEITQGVEMGRESRILVDVRVGVDGEGGRRVESVHLGGTAVEVASGRIAVPPDAGEV